MKGCDVMMADVPNAFIQAHLPQLEEGEEQVIMKITGVFVNLLVEMTPEVYGPFVILDNGKKVLYVQVLCGLYGMLIAALLWYKKFKSDLEANGFIFNPYDACVANKQVNGKQQTIHFHVDDLMSSHVDKKVNNEFAVWLNDMYGEHGSVKVHRGKIHNYLGMVFDFTTPGKVMVDMSDYVENFQLSLSPRNQQLHLLLMIFFLQECLMICPHNRQKSSIHLLLKVCSYASVHAPIYTPQLLCCALESKSPIWMIGTSWYNS